MMTNLTCGGLFSGIGGLELAAAMAGFDVLFHVEYDDWRRKILEKHTPRYWPNAQTFKDVHEVGTHNLPIVDVLCGGFPCQDVSLAGNRAGLEEGTRSGLWAEFRRIVSELRPRAVVVENVAGLLSLGGSSVIGDLAGLGYMGRWGTIQAADAHAPHARERVFIVAYAGRDRQPRETTEHRTRFNSENRGDPVHQSENYQFRDNFADSNHAGGSFYRGYELRHSRGEYRVGRSGDGVSARLDGFRGFPAYQNQSPHSYEPPRTVPKGTRANRSKRFEAVGNAVVPWQAYPIFYYLHEVLGR